MVALGAFVFINGNVVRFYIIDVMEKITQKFARNIFSLGW